MLVAEAHQGYEGLGGVADAKGIMWVDEHDGADFDARGGGGAQGPLILVYGREVELVYAMKGDVVEVDP